MALFTCACLVMNSKYMLADITQTLLAARYYSPGYGGISQQVSSTLSVGFLKHNYFC